MTQAAHVTAISRLDGAQLPGIRQSIDYFGFHCLPDAMSSETLEELAREACCRRAEAKRAVSESADLPYSSRVAPLGPSAIHVLGSMASAALLEPVFGRRFRYCPDASCYTFFEAGDFLETHRDDASNCEVTLLFYLSASPFRPDKQASGLNLSVYADDGDAPGALLKIIATPQGAIMFGRGSRFWHRRHRLQEGEHIWMLTACFTSADVPD
ncbi:hypothetical protein [Novosphingobium sp. PC22D]|uniref:hypothetical protein n=1 Tax=Novosphingobium sp. PC22D TaxID=1962403 RepID=UPI001145F9CD|nr:hypothetical protein [Novosphingobium sp. PC22D]